ncbi:hypothetical protein F3Y22_tig00111769pilonHSYRG00261 [Hibiscus syriacus]|uniref:Jasmonate O-methyltransferase n=1 Tax=Hibiscus syriacus TaxID=106335 RepID=A0A6A2XVL7_HIBSY|nr:hypothetical protein F3Y22_tig00111769pilonHSYRG00261 [Hibiscus syriacus]
MVKHITLETIQQLYKEVNPKSLGIADLGCSSGPNSLSLIKDIVEAVDGWTLRRQNGRCPAVFISVALVFSISMASLSTRRRLHIGIEPSKRFPSIMDSIPGGFFIVPEITNRGACHRWKNGAHYIGKNRPRTCR